LVCFSQLFSNPDNMSKYGYGQPWLSEITNRVVGGWVNNDPFSSFGINLPEGNPSIGQRLQQYLLSIGHDNQFTLSSPPSFNLVYQQHGLLGKRNLQDNEHRPKPDYHAQHEIYDNPNLPNS
jgi:hypothetical protein